MLPTKRNDRRGQARQILAGHQQFAAQRRQVVVVQRLFQHLAAEEIREDAHAAEEDSQAQIVEVEQPGEDQGVLADAVAAAMRPSSISQWTRVSSTGPSARK